MLRPVFRAYQRAITPSIARPRYPFFFPDGRVVLTADLRYNAFTGDSLAS
jgi:hypothetical protein